jgi:hypothetical protein
VGTAQGRAYDESVTSTPPVGEPEREWQQPPFQQPSFPQQPDPAPSGNDVPYPSQVVVPRPVMPPPSLAETVVGSLAGVVWPVMILLAVFTHIGFWPAIIFALIASTVLGNIRGHLRSQRRALPPPPRTDEGTDLR